MYRTLRTATIVGAIAYVGLVGQFVSMANGPAQLIGRYAIHYPGTADAYIVIDGHPAQLEYLDCLYRPDAVWFEDGSAACDPATLARIARWQAYYGATRSAVDQTRAR